jgi:hypothetical protein
MMRAGIELQERWNICRNFLPSKVPASLRFEGIRKQPRQLREPLLSLSLGRRPTAEPALVDRLGFDGVWRLKHTVVDLKLLHEAVVRSADGTAFAQLGEGFVARDAVFVHEIGHYDGGGA